MNMTEFLKGSELSWEMLRIKLSKAQVYIMYAKFLNQERDVQCADYVY